MTNPYALAAAGIALAAGISGCSGKGSQPAAAPSSSPVSVTTTVMIDGNKHTMTAGVECTSAAAQPNASPPESGDLTTRISVRDDTASVSLALSDEKPPMVDGFAISLTLANGQYQLPYQAARSATQVQATKEGKSYTVTGTGEATTPGQSATRPVTFGVHVTCP
ncbi:MULTISPECIES: lipoprotein LpqH [unclassified Mycobacterium]|uniref:lipoprotein LpqH n=1 Tax=unclassified Mycobacterium TaxID=2642494 RepID=UPI0006DC4E08|nr:MULTISPECIES: lipoprotein LpqH [unclassified Mycobacterium]